MADETTQRAVHKFFMERLQDLKPFTKKDLQQVTGWQDKALDTYWSKQYKGLVDDLGNGKFRMRERFRVLAPWKKFQAFVTQVRTLPPTYAPTVYDQVVAYEFYLPLAHEAALRVTLDSLFFKDALFPRLQRLDAAALRKLFGKDLVQPYEALFESIFSFIERKFGGYSIYHVDGRFRGAPLSTQEEVAAIQRSGQRYLVDETTAVVRFIFPVKGDEPEQVRFLFERLFLSAITDQVSGEDEIWVVESGMRNRVSIWKPKNG